MFCKCAINNFFKNNSKYYRCCINNHLNICSLWENEEPIFYSVVYTFCIQNHDCVFYILVKSSY